MGEFILNFAPTGMIPTKKTNKHVPISVSEIVEDVLQAAECGASMAHIHARDQVTGQPIVSDEAYGKIISGIREYNKEIIICVSLSGRNVSDPHQRALPLQLEGNLKPDMGSLTLSSLNFINQASVNAPETIQFLAATMKEKSISPEVEIFDTGMANYIHFLAKKELLPKHVYANILLGNIAGAQSSFSNISAILSNIPDNVTCSFAGLGSYQLQATSLSLSSGYGVRIGLEDNIWYDKKKTTLASNKNLVKRVIRLADELEMSPAHPTDVRKKLGLASGHGHYGLLQ
ncbi:3-keto-5-aminohexanoate cleavage protein [Xenorhabdus szentirmaii]|uniref:3-keto-5-aminohexanoate cleavage enzyme n=1 Tax=Xenorhabdus szentirmaii DSM 16338 TaxID=1427518 RepID=W1IXH3_9GAMM|nr:MULTISPECIES: 3-keto-5-aminohexanoate cleavage protein [Xenorhabdus]MBD2779448.1 3-keto-5-aminohexanoate cleavage protein [Xenorhabdus sp. 38]MBD2791026.1 3-keto-5-aminohexanoate cleavage protein [Xenorhabdus sp. CUL]MBD2804062.1 3-keto-5-aminohexanoate cleavage protein [Xenorhabdus sp. ZM]MBD2820150.1 3-keto-5-aminohexanoate cleavage protein [Xenorhabdus sp. 42]MBD2825246.1 3-keto-5-aminohexanoate cleavage protein [Xenorhabdus sp. 5]